MEMRGGARCWWRCDVEMAGGRWDVEVGDVGGGMDGGRR